MVIKSATALRNDYDKMVQLSKERQEPIYLTRNGEGEMVFLPIELWEKREAELDLLTELLHRERSRIAGARTFTMDEMRQTAMSASIRLRTNECLSIIWQTPEKTTSITFLAWNEHLCNIANGRKSADPARTIRQGCLLLRKKHF